MGKAELQKRILELKVNQGIASKEERAQHKKEAEFDAKAEIEKLNKRIAALEKAISTKA